MCRNDSLLPSCKFVLGPNSISPSSAKAATHLLAVLKHVNGLVCGHQSAPHSCTVLVLHPYSNHRCPAPMCDCVPSTFLFHCSRKDFRLGTCTIMAFVHFSCLFHFFFFISCDVPHTYCVLVSSLKYTEVSCMLCLRWFMHVMYGCQHTFTPRIVTCVRALALPVKMGVSG